MISPGTLVLGLLVGGVEHVQPALDLLRRVVQALALPALLAASLLATALPAAKLLVPGRGAPVPSPVHYGRLMLGREHTPVSRTVRV